MTDAARRAIPKPSVVAWRVDEPTRVIIDWSVAGSGRFLLESFNQLTRSADRLTGIGISKGAARSLALRISDALLGPARATWSGRRLTSTSPGGVLAVTLLRTTEESSGLPCSISWLLHGLGPAPVTGQAFLLTGAHRISAVRRFLEFRIGTGKTMSSIGAAFESLERQIDGLLVRGLPPTTADLNRLDCETERLALFLLLTVQRLLAGGVLPVEYLISVPPHASSPCGVQRLAVPLVPNAPGRGPFFGPTDLALAA